MPRMILPEKTPQPQERPTITNQAMYEAKEQRKQQEQILEQEPRGYTDSELAAASWIEKTAQAYNLEIGELEDVIKTFHEREALGRQD